MARRLMVVAGLVVTLLGVGLLILGTGIQVVAGPRTSVNLQTMTGTLGITKTLYLPFVVKPDAPPTATSVPPTATMIPPTATATKVPPTATTIPPTATETATTIPSSGGPIQITYIEYNPAGLDSVGEYVDLRNMGANTVSMSSWTLRDEANTAFTFPTFQLAPGASVRVWIRSGVNDGANLYWGRNSATWNNNGDTAILRDASGTEIDRCSYSGGGSGVDC